MQAEVPEHETGRHLTRDSPAVTSRGMKVIRCRAFPHHVSKGINKKSSLSHNIKCQGDPCVTLSIFTRVLS